MANKKGKGGKTAKKANTKAAKSGKKGKAEEEVLVGVGASLRRRHQRARMSSRSRRRPV